MKYFIDTEFIEGFHKPLFGKRRHYIDLISIGIVSEEGMEYSAISNGYNCDDASDWVKENVILPLYDSQRSFVKEMSAPYDFHEKIGKSNAEIASDIISFMRAADSKNEPEFYGYFSDYDWVLFCSLFGTMMDLPKGFPMYCIDIKQMLDSRARALREPVDKIKSNLFYPKEENEHLAIADARWNKKLYEFLMRP